MAGTKGIAVIILLNAIFFTLVSANSCPPPPAKKAQAKCQKDTLKFGVCGNWLGLVHEVLGSPPSKECCTLIRGLADLEAAVCLCTALKANVLGVVKVKIPIAVTLLINSCGKQVPKGFQCA